MTKAEIRRERMRVQAAFRKIQRKLGQSFDLTFCVETDDNVLSVSPNVWPQDPKSFTVWFHPDFVSALTRHELEQDALHETYHMIHWPLRESAVEGMDDSNVDEWQERVWEPVIREITRRTAPYILRRPWVGGN